VLIGAWVRHFFNLRHAGRTVWWIPATALLASVALAVAIRPDEGGGAGAAGAVTAGEAVAIVERRCVPCHSESPAQEGYDTAPAGVRLDTREQITAQAEAIREQAVRTEAMPLGNVTGMTEEEREELGAWLDTVE
jgi:uncharacterized membrane protein